MHGLVRWRASSDAANDKHWRWYAIFIAAVCSQISKEADTVHFRRHAEVYLPLGEQLIKDDGEMEDDRAA